MLGERVGQRDPVGIAALAQLVLVGHRAAAALEPKSERPKRAPSSSAQLTSRTVTARLAVLGQPPQHLDAAHDVEAAVEPAAVRHRVEMAADQQSALGRAAQREPLVARLVDLLLDRHRGELRAATRARRSHVSVQATRCAPFSSPVSSWSSRSSSTVRDGWSGTGGSLIDHDRVCDAPPMQQCHRHRQRHPQRTAHHDRREPRHAPPGPPRRLRVPGHARGSRGRRRSLRETHVDLDAAGRARATAGTASRPGRLPRGPRRSGLQQMLDAYGGLAAQIVTPVFDGDRLRRGFLAPTRAAANLDGEEIAAAPKAAEPGGEAAVRIPAQGAQPLAPGPRARGHGAAGDEITSRRGTASTASSPATARTTDVLALDLGSAIRSPALSTSRAPAGRRRRHRVPRLRDGRLRRHGGHPRLRLPRRPLHGALPRGLGNRGRPGALPELPGVSSRAIHLPVSSASRPRPS